MIDQAAAAPRLPRVRRWPYALVGFLLLAQMAAAMIVSAAQETPTVDEPVYVGAAVTQLARHSVEDNFEHPPLGKLIMGAALAFAHPRLNATPGADEGMIGHDLLYASGNNPWHLMFLARLTTIVLTLLFALVAFAFARDLLGTGAGLAALALFAFDPDLIAHGSLATLDVAAAGFLFTAAWLLWRARYRPALYLPLAGLAVGAAAATRASTLPAVPVLVLLAALSRWRPARAAETGQVDRGAWPRLARLAGAALLVAALTIATVWAVYLVVDPRMRFTTPSSVPHFGGIRGLIVSLTPFPEPYRAGMAYQFGLEDRTWGGFLFGHRYLGGLWYYYPAALLVKTPLGMMVLWLAGVATMLSVKRLRPAVPYLLAVPAVLFAATLPESRDFGTRYVIFMPMFLAVVAVTPLVLRRRQVTVAVVALVVFVAVSSVRTFPYYIPYSNEAFGGPSKTYLRLHDSNSDWGQDLGRTAKVLATKYPGQPVWLDYFGGGDPAWYGIHAMDPNAVPRERVHGLLVVSNDRIGMSTPHLRELLATSTLLEQVGHSISIYRR